MTLQAIIFGGKYINDSIQVLEQNFLRSVLLENTFEGKT